MSTVELTDLEHRGGEWLRGGGVHADFEEVKDDKDDKKKSA